MELEAELADLHGKEAALVFTSGYVSNHTGIATIARLLPDCLILSDALNHNSMIEGVRAAGCAKQIWRHNDLEHLEELLSRAAPGRPKLIVFESVHSMDGDVAPLEAICELAERYNAMTYLDDAPCIGAPTASAARTPATYPNHGRLETRLRSSRPPSVHDAGPYDSRMTLATLQTVYSPSFRCSA